MISYKHHILDVTQSSRVLYRFQPISENSVTGKNRIDTITNDKIWASDPKTFNDPFDLNLRIDDLTLNAPYDDKFIIELVRLMLSNCKTDNPNSLITSDFISDIENCIDTEINITEIEKIIKTRLKRQGIICLTPHINHTLMWSHYANSHRGFAIEYQFNQTICGGDWYEDKVEYTSKLEKFCFTEVLTNPNRVLTKLSLIKSHHWSYENEVRLINKKTFGSFVDIPEHMKTSGIYAGLKIEPENLQKLKDAAQRMQIPIFKMRKNGYDLIPDDPDRNWISDELDIR